MPKKEKYWFMWLYRFIVLGIYNFGALLRVRESLVTKKMNRDVSSWGGQFWRRADTQWTKKPLIWFINMQVKIQKESSKFYKGLWILQLTLFVSKGKEKTVPSVGSAYNKIDWAFLFRDHPRRRQIFAIFDLSVGIFVLLYFLYLANFWPLPLHNANVLNG